MSYLSHLCGILIALWSRLMTIGDLISHQPTGRLSANMGD
jgi:hypothetical protein